MDIKIGGVPEYFNLPIRLAIEEGAFEKQDLQVTWVEYTQGTGKMVADLESGHLDFAILLTEGAIKAIYEGNPSKIIKTHVDSSLLWGIHTPAEQEELPLELLLRKNIAISRYGSGSHLMAIHLAQELGIPVEDLRFVIVDNLEGARKAFAEGRAAVFFWEKYTTKPYVDNGEFRRVNIHPTPWPSFVIVGSDRMVNLYPESVFDFIGVINEYVTLVKKMVGLKEVIARRYQLETSDVETLLEELRWNTGLDLPLEYQEEVLSTFDSAKILGEGKNIGLYFQPTPA